MNNGERRTFRRIQRCFNCGEELGMLDSWPGDLIDCGRTECAEEARYQRDCEDAEARSRAEDDNYEAYR